MNYKESADYTSLVKRNLKKIADEEEDSDTLNSEQLDQNYILELIELFQGTELDRFRYAKDVLLRIMHKNPYNLVQFLSENNFFTYIIDIFHQIPDQSVFDSCVEILSSIFEETKRNPKIIDLIPNEVFDTLIELLEPETAPINISKILSAFIVLLESNSYTNQLYDKEFLNLCFIIDESLVNEAIFQGNESIEMEIISQLLRICIFFCLNIDKEKLSQDDERNLLERFKFWVLKDDDKCDPFYQSLKGFSVIASIDITILEDYLKDSPLMDEIYKILRFANETLVICSLNFLYYCSAEYHELINLEILTQNIQPHLIRRGNSISSEISSLACKIMAIFLSFQETHEFLIDQGIISMLSGLLSDQLLDVKMESSLAISNILTSCEPQVIQYVLSEYPIISPMISLLETDQTDIIIGVLHSLIKIFDANDVLGNALEPAIHNIIEEIDIERLQELSELTESVPSDLARQLLERFPE